MAAADNDSTTKELEELVTCAICLHHYSDPRLLPCSHTYCFKCIENLIKSGIFQCPLRDGTTLTPNTIATLPMNRTAKDMVELVSKMSLSPENQQQVKCDNCDEERATFWCEKCTCNYCERCTRIIHNIKSHQSHNVMPLSEKLSVFCDDHPEEKYKYWCQQCQLLLCRDCVLLKHKTHEYQAIEEAAAEVKTMIHSSLMKLTVKQIECKLFLIKVQNLIKQQQDLHRIEKDELEEAFTSLHIWLENRKKLLTEQMEHNNGEIMSSLETHEKYVQGQLKMMKIQKSYGNQLINSTNNVQLLKKRNTLPSNCNYVNEQKLPSVEKRLVFEGEQLQLYRESLSKIASVEIHDSCIWRLGMPKDAGDTVGTAHCPEGYQFQLNCSVKLISVRMQINNDGPVFVYVLDNNGKIIKKTSAQGTGTWSWIKFSTNVELKNGYSVFLSAITSRRCLCQAVINDTNIRIVNQNCSVLSKKIQVNTDQNVGSVMLLQDNRDTLAVYMEIEVEHRIIV